MIDMIQARTLLVLGMLGCVATASAATFHVSPKGDDASPGSAEAPWRSFRHALARLGPGDTLQLAPGVYREPMEVQRGGTPGSPVTIAGGLGVILDGRGVGAGHGVYAKGLSHLLIRDLELRNWGDEGVRIDDGQHVAIERCTVRNSGIESKRLRNGVTLRRVSHFTVRDCRFINNFRSGIEVDMGEYGLIERCLATDNNGDAPFGGYYADADGINLQNCRHVRVSQCRSSHNGEDGIDVGLWEGFEGNSYDVFVVDSVAHDHPGKGLCVSGSHDPDFKTHDVHFVRCVSYRNDPTNRLGKKGLGFQVYENAKRIRLVHCTLSDNYRGAKIDAGAGDVWLVNNSIGNSNPTQYNLNATEAEPPLRVTHTNWFGGVPRAGAGQAVLDEDPRFVDRHAGGFGLRGNSPNRDAGTSLTRAAATGSGEVLPVEDAGFFSDGWRAFPGDTIQLNGQRARVLEVLDGDRLRLDRPLAWEKRDGVALPFVGDAPDLGAVETGGHGRVLRAGPAALNDSELADQIEAVLLRHDVDWWYPRCVDPAGGFFETYDEHGNPVDEAFRTTVFQARMTWTAALIAERMPQRREAFVEHALHGMRYLVEHLRDAETGGYYWARTLDGQATGRYRGDKHAYALSFAIYALAAVERVAPGHSALEAAQETFAWLEANAYDAESGGYLEAFHGDDTPMLAPQDRPGPARHRDAIGTAYGFKSFNTHLHLMEAFVELYHVWPDETLKQRIDELERLHVDRLYAEPGGMHLFLTRELRPVPDTTSFGHNVEAAHLLHAAHRVLGRTNDVPRRLVDHALRFGVDEQFGGLFNDGSAFRPAVGRDKAWWAQAEALYAFALMHELHGRDDPRYRVALGEVWRFIVDHQLDWEDGNWNAQVYRDGTPKPGEKKATHWKAAYHTTRALIETLAFLRDGPAESTNAP